MNVNEILINSYGKFENASILTNLNPRVNLIYGQNEAGKTTLFHLFMALFYGFYPANRRDYPYVNAEYDGVQFEALLTVNQKKYRVKRTMKSKPELEIFDGQAHHKSGNQTLRFLEHVSRSIYENVYALDVDSLNALTDKTWSEIQEKLLFNMGTELLANPSQIVAEFEQKAGEIWRENRRGKQKIRMMDDALKSLKKERNDALKAYENVYEMEERLKEVQSEYASLEKQYLQKEDEIKSAKKWIPIWNRISEKQQLSYQCIDTSDVNIPLRENYMEYVDATQQQLSQEKNEIETLDRNLLNKRKEVKPLLMKEQQLLEHEHELQQLLQWAQSLNHYAEQKGQLDLQIKKIENGILHQGKYFFEFESAKELIGGLSEINIGDLITQIRKLTSLEKHNTPEGMAAFLDEQKNNFIGGALLGLGIAIAFLGYGMIHQNQILSLSGAVISGAISMYVAIQLLKRKNMGSKWKKGIVHQQEHMIEELIELYPELKFQEEMLKNISTDDVRNFEKLLEQFAYWGDYQTQWKHSIKQFEDQVDQIQRLKIVQGIASDHYQNMALQLSNRLEELRRQERENALASKEIEQMEHVKEQLETKYQERKKAYDEVVEELLKIGCGNVEHGALKIGEHLRAQMRIHEIDQYLKEVDLQQLPIDEINENDLESIEKKREILHNQVSELKVQEVALQKDLDQLKERFQLNAINSHIKTLEVERQELAEKRDHLMIMISLIREAEERFRVRNQPDVLVKASTYFEKMTKGQYRQLLMDIENGNPKLQVIKNGATMPVDFDASFSKGTQHQLFLALRLALIDHLDSEHVKLPIFFDESLVNWDQERLEPTLDLINKVASVRQVFFFTCHDHFARMIEERMHVTRIQLDGGTPCPVV